MKHSAREINAGTVAPHRSKLRALMSLKGHSRPSHFVPVLNNVRYASDSDHSRYESELTLWAMCGRLRVGKGFLHECSIGRCSHVFGL
jgi:hypothetical protein